MSRNKKSCERHDDGGEKLKSGFVLPELQTIGSYCEENQGLSKTSKTSKQLGCSPAKWPNKTRVSTEDLGLSSARGNDSRDAKVQRNDEAAQGKQRWRFHGAVFRDILMSTEIHSFGTSCKRQIPPEKICSKNFETLYTCDTFKAPLKRTSYYIPRWHLAARQSGKILALQIQCSRVMRTCVMEQCAALSS